MTIRGVTILSVLVVLAAGAFVVDQHINFAPPPAATKTTIVADITPTPSAPALTNSIEAKPAGAKPVEAKPAEAAPAEAKPVATAPVESKPLDSKPVEAKLHEIKPPEAKPAEATAAATKPIEAKPVEATAVVAKPAKTNPVETKPADSKPVTLTPVAPQPVAVQPADAKPVEAKPVEAKPAETAAAPPPATPPVATSAGPVVAALPAEPPAPAVIAPPPVVMVPAPMPPERPDIAETKKPLVAAKTLFAAEKLPSLGKAMAIGYYPRGCLSGGVALPVSGPTWQVMRVSRNRMWGHPSLVKFLETFAPRAARATGWHGVLIGDMAQPRGGPLPFGHMSHQIGLDVDIWFMPMPGHLLSKTERDKISAISLVAPDGKHVNPKTWQPKADVAFIRTAAEQPEVERVLVNAAIKKEICRMQGKKHPAWMDKVRPWYGHDDHIHVRLACPPGSPNCRKQPPVPDAAGCGKSLDFWFSDRVLHPKYKKGGKPRKPITLADLPPACKKVLAAPDARTAKN